MSKIELDNLVILYDTESTYSKQTMKRVRRVERIGGTISALIAMIAIIVGALMERFLPGLLLTIAIVTIDIVVLLKLLKKISPKHYKFVSCMEKIDKDSIEVGWFNNRYIVLEFNEQCGWKAKSLASFIKTTNYKLIDKAKHNENVKMTIDLTKETIEIICEDIIPDKVEV